MWTISAAESDRNYFSLPRTPNSFISRHKSVVSSSRCPKRCQTMSPNSLAGRRTAKKWNFTSTHYTFLGQKAGRLVQILLFAKWQKIMQSTMKVSSERFSKASTWTASSSQSETLKKQSKSTRRFKISLAKLDLT